MPNTRRRKFSVKNNVICPNRDTSQYQNGLQLSLPSTSKCKPNEENAKDHDSRVLFIAIKESNKTFNKSIMTSTSIANLSTKFDGTNKSPSNNSVATISYSEILKRDEKQIKKERKHKQRDQRIHEHRVKVRSPRRRNCFINEQKNVISEQSTATNKEVLGQMSRLEMTEETTHVIEVNENVSRQSDHSLDEMCRICHGGANFASELGSLISACSCRGTVGKVHVSCLERWLTESGKSRCELCGVRYYTRRIHRYGVPRSLIMWIFSENTKQLMVDSLGIMLMSPLAALAAWLSGKTLAGLMIHSNHNTPWPLASTFVLACMTLVCYYFWIVSAATRHALHWWIWYRSQYETRLQFQNNSEE